MPAYTLPLPDLRHAVIRRGLSSPKLVRDALKLRSRSSARLGESVGLLPTITAPCATKLCKLAQHRQRHALAAPAEIENAITRAARSHEPAILDRQLMEHNVAVHEVEAVAVRRVVIAFHPKTAVSGPSSP